MKAKLLYKLPEDSKAFLCAAKSTDMAMALWEITANLRKRTEWRFEDRDAEEVIDYIFQSIHEIINSNNIDIDELID